MCSMWKGFLVATGFGLNGHVGQLCFLLARRTALAGRTETSIPSQDLFAEAFQRTLFSFLPVRRVRRT